MFSGSEHFFPKFEKWILEIASKKGGLVLDLGTPRPFRKELAWFERRFDGVRVLTLDYPGSWKTLENWHPSIGGDIGYLPLKSACADGVICKDVIEHVPDPFAAVREIKRVMKPGAIGYFTVPGSFPYHAIRGSGAHDYWRFTREGAEKLFEGFASTQVLGAGGVVFILRSFSGRLNRVVFHRAFIPFWNWVDRAIPSVEQSHIWMIRAVR